jgi:hypothetical protein
MLPVDAIDLGLHVGMSALHQDGELAHQSSRAKPFKQDFLRRALAKTSARTVSASLGAVLEDDEAAN